jgi:hypothetical protein
MSSDDGVFQRGCSFDVPLPDFPYVYMPLNEFMTVELCHLCCDQLRPLIFKGGTQKLPQQVKIVETYWHDHSLESSWGPLSDGAISYPIHPFSGE